MGVRGSGPGSLLTSRNTGQGVLARGEFKGDNPRRRRETDQPAAEQSARGGVLTGPEPRAGDPKPSDLSRGRAKRGESPVEARRGSDVQIVPLTLG